MKPGAMTDFRDSWLHPVARANQDFLIDHLCGPELPADSLVHRFVVAGPDEHPLGSPDLPGRLDNVPDGLETYDLAVSAAPRDTPRRDLRRHVDEHPADFIDGLPPDSPRPISSSQVKQMRIGP